MSTPTLDKIADRGNRTVDGKRDNRITCADGFSLSVVAGGAVYCLPRPALRGMDPFRDEVSSDYSGPFTHLEVGFPSELPEPWSEWSEHADGDRDDAVIYSYVPVERIRSLIESHGGEA